MRKLCSAQHRYTLGRLNRSSRSKCLVLRPCQHPLPPHGGSPSADAQLGHIGGVQNMWPLPAGPMGVGWRHKKGCGREHLQGRAR